MSGIAGIMHFNGRPVEPGQVEAMTAAMHYRGPDGINHWRKGNIALGQCMLRTTVESRNEVQPFVSNDGKLQVVFDGRLDNRQDLSLYLQKHGLTPRTSTDAELVLLAYEAWDDDSPFHLLGDFAYALWDGRKQVFFCARDHFGVKPFHYVLNGTLFAFASDEEAFFQLPGVSRAPNDDRIAYFLVPEFQDFDFNSSWLRDVRKLPPGCSMTVTGDGKTVIRRYWQLEAMEEVQLESDAEYEDAFRSIFAEAILCRTRISGNPALMLSGGVDSASIAGMAFSLLNGEPDQQLETFSLVSDDAMTCAETRLIHAIVKDRGQNAHLIRLSDFQNGINAQELMQTAWGRAHPVDNSILLPSMMYAAASRRGLRAMFDGIDGDLVTWTPLRYMAPLLQQGHWNQAWQESRHASRHNTYLRSFSPLNILAKSAWDAFAPSSLRRFKNWSFAATRAGTSGLAHVNPDFAKRIHLAERLKIGRMSFIGNNADGEQQRHIHALTQPGIARGMEGFDRVAAYHAIEPRHPWSDRRLVEFYMRMPARQKARHGWTKHLVRTAMAPYLDPAVRWNHGKEHLGWQITTRAVTLEGVQSVFKTSLKSAGNIAGPYFSQRALVQVRNFLEGRAGVDTTQLYDQLTLALWLRRIGSATCK